MRQPLLVVALLMPALADAQADGAYGFGFYYSVATDRQPVVTAVAAGSAAEAAGLVPGDSLLSADSIPLTGLSAAGVGDAIDEARSDGPAVVYRFIREGRERTVEIGQAPYDSTELTRQGRIFYCQAGDCLDGVGVWRAPDGERYEGAFSDGWRQGEGTLVLANGDLYVGTFARGVIDGVGSYVWSDGEHYTGDVARGAPHGQGVRTYADGGIYIGKFADGLRHGPGTLRRPDGSYWTGLWESGNGVKGTDHEPTGEVRATGPFVD